MKKNQCATHSAKVCYHKVKKEKHKPFELISKGKDRDKIVLITKHANKSVTHNLQQEQRDRPASCSLTP